MDHSNLKKSRNLINWKTFSDALDTIIKNLYCGSDTLIGLALLSRFVALNQLPCLHSLEGPNLDKHDP